MSSVDIFKSFANSPTVLGHPSFPHIFRQNDGMEPPSLRPWFAPLTAILREYGSTITLKQVHLSGNLTLEIWRCSLRGQSYLVKVMNDAAYLSSEEVNLLEFIRFMRDFRLYPGDCCEISLYWGLTEAETHYILVEDFGYDNAMRFLTDKHLLHIEL
jgi:hypothetical protein